MARKKWSPSNLFKQLLFFLVGAVLTGFLTVFFAKFLGHYIGAHFSAGHDLKEAQENRRGFTVEQRWELEARIYLNHCPLQNPAPPN